MERRTIIATTALTLALPFAGCLEDTYAPSEPTDQQGTDAESRDGGVDDHIAEEGDTFNARIYNYRDEELTFTVLIAAEDDETVVDGQFRVDAGASRGIGTVGEVFREYTGEVTVEGMGVDASQRFEAGGKGTLEIRLRENGTFEIFFIPID